MYEALARFSVESASVALFTQTTYRDSLLKRPRDSSALADALARALEQREQLARMGLAALERVRPHTHLAMHRQRAELLTKHLRK